MLRYPFLLLWLLTATISQARNYSLHFIDNRTDASFRGLSVAGDDAVWVSGSKGWVGRSSNGGKDWSFRQVPGYEQYDFRSLYAFDSNTAIIANAGTPAHVLRTTDGGETWQPVYQLNDSAAFIDGIGFWNTQDGIIHGDPILGRMLLLATSDGGRSWSRLSGSPVLEPGEASFAASGTAIHCFGNASVVVATGGLSARLFFSGNKGRTWKSIGTPMLAGSASTGIFSFITGRNRRHWLLAGGDYKEDTLTSANCFYSFTGGRKWLAPERTARGYRECLARITSRRSGHKAPAPVFFAIGPSGIDSSGDNGATWQPFSDEKGFHVLKASPDQRRLFLAGGQGKLAIIELK